MTTHRQNWLRLVQRLYAGRTPKILVRLLVGWLLLLALVYFAAPPLARSVLAAQLGKALGRDVTIEQVAINPLALSVDVLGLSVKNQVGAEQWGFDQLHVNLSSFSVAQAGIVVDEIEFALNRNGDTADQEFSIAFTHTA